MAQLKLQITVDPEFREKLVAAVTALDALDQVMARGDLIRIEV